MKTYSLSELKESLIMFDKKPPRFMFYIVGSLLIAIIGLTIFANYSIKTYVVKASGLVYGIGYGRNGFSINRFWTGLITIW